MASYHVFSLSKSLLETLIPRNLATQPRLQDEKTQQADQDVSSQPTTNAAATPQGPRSCNICQGASFLDVNEQRNHFRSDWHRYNVKLKLNGQNTVSIVQFSQLVDALEESISGSASSSSDDDDGENDTVAALISKTARKTARSRSPSPSTNGARSSPQTPLCWFHSPPATQIGVYKALFDLAISNGSDSLLNQLKVMQECQKPEGRKWALFMVAGGHFAGAVVRVARPQLVDGEDASTRTKKGKPKKPPPDNEILLHKTFHRYTTRRKQGGSQSVNDNAKGNAHSAGAMLRRYGEQALRDDIRTLLQDWSEEIDQCERIWIRASVSNRRIFFEHDDPIIPKGDERLRTFPFPTRRPTQSELNRCITELTRVKTSHLTEDALRAQDEAYIASLPKLKPKPVTAPQPPKEKPVQPSVPKLSKEDEILLENWQRLTEMISKGRLEVLKAFWEKEGKNMGRESGIDIKVPELVPTTAGQTMLHIASEAGQEEIVRWLLEERKADPTIDMPMGSNLRANEEDGVEEDEGKKGKTAYEVASSREVRNVFRRCAGEYPDWWDWLRAGRVPSVLSQEMEEQREEKKKVRRKGLKEKIKERESKIRELPKEEPQPVKEEVTPKKEVNIIGPRRLGGSGGDAGSVAGLTPEMRARVERERRARAAEARMKTLAG